MTPVCRLDDVPNGGAHSATLMLHGVETQVFLFRRGERVRAFVNSCPHTGANLDWQPGRFMDYQGRHFLCGTHGALFRLDDGFCISGPCKGRSLKSVAVKLRGDAVVLDDDYPGFPTDDDDADDMDAPGLHACDHESHALHA